MANMTHSQTVPQRKIYVKDLNPYITCNLCNGYLIEATTLVDCLHVFCRACILRYFENSKMGCPMCNTVYKKKNFPCFRPDPIMQSLVYKLVPGLYSKEVQRRDDFYRSTAIRASSSCSEDSVIGDLSQEHEEWMTTNVDDQFQYFSPDDSISLSVEYYQPHLDQNANREDAPTQSRTSPSGSVQSVTEPNVINKLIVSDGCTNGLKTGNEDGEVVECSGVEDSQKAKTVIDIVPKIEDGCTKSDAGESDKDGRKDKRYLQCPAAVTMSILQKFVRMKYALSLEHKVDIIYNGEVLPQYFSLMDVAYTFKWQRLKPMRFYYRIFTPIRIKIIKTTSNGEKQLQVVSVNQNNPNSNEKHEGLDEDLKTDSDAEMQNNINKENLLAQLNLKSKAKIEQEQQQLASANLKNLSLKTMNPKGSVCLKDAISKSKDLKDLKSVNFKETYSGVTNSKITKTPKEVTLKVETKSFIPSENSVKIDRLKKIYEPDDIDQKLSKLYENHKESKKLDQIKSPKHNNHYGNKDLKLIYSKANSVETKPPRGSEDNCIYEYEERDEDEIRKFAEKRDREWALQKQKDEEEEKYRSSKKRKKSKHSKNDFAHKKRKLHAEITSNESLNKEEPLKLKVKLTPHNGHKHKHHKNYQNNSPSSEPTSPKPSSELSSKEKLLQMRQVRHKNITAEKDKQRDQDMIPYVSESNVSDKSTQSENKDKDPEPKVTFHAKPTTNQAIDRKVYGNKNIVAQTKTMETSGTQTANNNNNNNNNNKMKDIPAGTGTTTTPKNETLITGKTLRSDFPIKTNASQELNTTRYPTVQLERHEQAERQVQKTYLKTFQSYTEKLAESVAQKADMSKMMFQNRISQSQSQSSTHNNKSPLERKIANLHQQYSSENKPKQQQPPGGKISVPEKPQTLLNSQYQTGFTVSKIEAGTKRKLETVHDEQDKRPSLEITLINPPVTNNSPSQMQKSKSTTTEAKPGMKRPPPATIPLERIKKSSNLKSGISIIPKIPESQGPLDLSSSCKHPDTFLNRPNGSTGSSASPKVQQPTSSPKNTTVAQERVKTSTSDKNIQLSNLQMLSKVALEHSNINKSPVPTLLNISKKPPMPTLQTIRIPMPNQQNMTATKSPNLARLPKLTEINKSTFRMMSPQMRNMRPNQNQNIRSIPNPSLLVRQQNQNRLNSMSSAQIGNGDGVEDGSKTNATENNKITDQNEKKNDDEKKEKEQKSDNSEKKDNNSETNAPKVDDSNKATS
ncbi:protein suppressor 2 of zeste [Agrilus planipennis]|uniref:Protein suppressor 2 of zeste n=1 Tax=Agrilus planipennis TaxID=224129 RepID=A0A1W4W2N8_AGRPL|nr:protein suppressor 2 of zeste [Agrilus planipennis]XP_018318419.1 protein suppressor 2 of zeste [Agrilus planipennis]